MGYVGTLVHGSDDRGRLIRRTLMRWLNLSHIMVMQSISICVKKRFPTSQHLVDAGNLFSRQIFIFMKFVANIKIEIFFN